MRAFQEHFHESFIVNVASNWAGDLDLTDLHFRHRGYDNDTAYRQSKQCDRMLTQAWANILKDSKVNVCHPGDPKTKLSTDLGYNLWASTASAKMIETGSPIPLLCGYQGELRTTAGWFDGRSQTPSRCRFMSMTDKVQKLLEECDKFCA